MEERLLMAIVMPTLFICCTYVLTTFATSIVRTRRDRAQADVMTKMLDRLTTANDVVAFVESEAGRQFLQGPKEAQTNQAGRVLNSAQGGLVLAAAGVGMLLGSNTALDARVFLLTMGGIVLCVGIGLVVSAALSYALLQRWGLMQTK